MLTHVHAADNVALVATIDPDAYSADTYTSDWVDAADFHTLLAVVAAGTLGTNATIDAKLEQADTAAGGNAKDVSGSDITQMTQAGTDQSDTQALISVQNDALDVENGFRWVRLSITVGTAASDVAGFIVGTSPRIGPADDNDLASVGEVVRV